MKKLITILVPVFILTFFYPANNGFSDILKDLQKFTESLGDVVTQISELSRRMSTLESDNQSRDKQIAEYNQSMINIEAHLKDLDANVERVANMASLKGVKDIVKSFEGTLDVFKKRFAELANRVEDQEVKTNVLEKMYKTANQPLDSLMQTIDSQKGLIDRLEGKLNSQETLISSLRDNLEKQTSLAASLGIEELNARISKLESGVLVRSTATHDEHATEAPVDSHGKHAAEQHVTTPVGHEEHAAEEHVTAPAGHDEHVMEQHVTAPTGHQEEPKDHISKSDLIDIGQGFSIKNIKFKPFGSSSQISGEIMNNSENDYGMLDFKLQAYDIENVPLGGLGFSIYGFKKGKVGSFKEIIAGIEPKKIAKYSIYPAKRDIVTDTGEKTIRIIEKQLPSEKAETTKVVANETAPENLEDLLFDEAKPEDEKLKGFEDAGSKFYSSEVSFRGFGSSSTVTGKIKNNSKKDFYNASFVMKIFGKEYGLITQFDFSVRNIKSGEVKNFEEIIAGVSPIDIDRYEISFKSSY